MPRTVQQKPQAPLVSITTAAAEPAPEPKEVEKEPLSPTWFWDKIAELPKDQWGKVYDVILMRMADSKVPMQAGEKGYLDIFLEPITLAVVKQKYGGGKYRIILEKNGRYATSHDFEIEGAPLYDFRRERPPAGAVASDGNTGVLQQFVGVLRDELQHARESSQEPGGATERALEMLTKASDKAMDTVLRQVPQGVDPTKQLESLVTTAQKLGLIGQPIVAATNPLLEKLAGIAIERLLNPADPLAQLTAMLTVFEKLDALRGEGGGGKQDWKAAAVQEGFKHLPDILHELREGREANIQVSQNRRAYMEAQERTAAVLRGVPTPQGTARTAAAEPARTATTLSPSSAASATEAPTGPLPAPPMSSPLRTVPIGSQRGPASEAMLDTESDSFTRWLKTRMVELIREGAEAEVIVDFLDGAKPGFANDLVRFPAEQVTAFLSADSILAQAVADPRWPEVLRRARAYILDAEEQVAPVPVAN